MRLALRVAQEIRVSLSRELTLFDITMIGIAGMIGAGIFALTGIATGIAGPAILLAFLLNGITATFTGLAYAELGSAMPEAGGSYLWVREAMGDHFGFLAGWCDWAAHTIACALYAVTFGAFFSEFMVKFAGFTYLPQLTLSKISALLIVTLLTYINYLGAKESGRVGGFVTLFKVGILVLFAAFGIYHTLIKPDWVKAFTTPSFMPNGVTGVLAAMGLTFIAFEGYEIIVQSGEEVKRPERNIPRAIVISLWVAVAIYILVAFALIGSVEAEVPSWMYLGRLAEFSLIRVANQIMPFGAIMIIAGGLVSTISAMNATIYSSSRVSFALGRIGYLPESLSRINEKTRTPHFAIFFSYVIISIMSLAPIEAVASAADVMFLILFILVNFVLVLLRYRRPDLKRSFKVPLVPYLPLLAILVQIIIGYYLLTELEHGSFVVAVTAIWILFGSLVYFAYSEKEKAHRMEEISRTVYEEKPVEEAGYKILVPVANPAIADKLGRFAESVARSKGGQVVFLSVLTLPAQTPFSAAAKYIEESKKLIQDVIKYVTVPAGGIVKIGRRASEAILNVIDEEKPDLVIMGWRGRTFRRDFVLGSTIDPILLRARSDIAVIRFEPGRGWKPIRRILIPTAGGPHAKLAAELAKSVASGDATITLIYVGRTKDDEKIAQKAFEETEEILQDLRDFPNLRVTRKFIVAENPVKAIAREAENYDAVFMGSTAEPFLKNFLMGVFPEKVVRETSKTVVMTRKWVRLVDVLKK